MEACVERNHDAKNVSNLLQMTGFPVLNYRESYSFIWLPQHLKYQFVASEKANFPNTCHLAQIVSKKDLLNGAFLHASKMGHCTCIPCKCHCKRLTTRSFQQRWQMLVGKWSRSHWHGARFMPLQVQAHMECIWWVVLDHEFMTVANT